MTFCTTTVFAAVVNAVAAAAVIGAVVSMALDGTDVAVPITMPPPPPPSPPTPPPLVQRDYDDYFEYTRTAQNTGLQTCSNTVVEDGTLCTGTTFDTYLCAATCNFPYEHDATADSDAVAALLGGTCEAIKDSFCPNENRYYTIHISIRVRYQFACPFSCPWPIVAPSPPSPPPLVPRDYDDYFEYYRYGQYTGTQTCSNNNNLGDYTSQCNGYGLNELYMCAATCNFDYVHDATADSDAVAASLWYMTCADSKLEGQPCATEDLYYQETIRQRAKYQFACPVTCHWDIENAAA